MTNNEKKKAGRPKMYSEEEMKERNRLSKNKWVANRSDEQKKKTSDATLKLYYKNIDKKRANNRSYMRVRNEFIRLRNIEIDF